MDWVFEHFQLIIVVAGAIAYWINQRRREKEGKPADYDEDGIPENQPARPEFDPSTMDAEEAERTRSLQEELRRKREQRTGGAPADPYAVPRQPPPVPREVAPPTVHQDPLGELMAELARKVAPQATPPPVPVSGYKVDEEMLARQRDMEEQLRALEEQRRSLRKQVHAIATREASSEVATRSAPGSLLSDLRNSEHVRRAIILNEVLGKPLAARG